MKVTENRIKEMGIILWDKILNWIAGIENRENYIKKGMHPRVHWSTVYNSQGMETT